MLLRLLVSAPVLIVLSSGVCHAQRTPELEWQGSMVSVAVTASSLEDGRAAAWQAAGRSAISRGHSLAHERLIGESMAQGRYAAVLEYEGPAQPAGPAPPAPRQPERHEVAQSPRGLPAWILVVPLQGDGRSARWDRSSAWTRSWIAPLRRDGTRLLGLAGDGDDREQLGSRAIAGESAEEVREGLFNLSRRHGAPAVAMLRLEANLLRVFVLRGGEVRSDVVAIPASGRQSMEDLRGLALRTILALGSSRPPSNPDPGEDEVAATVQIAGFDQAADGLPASVAILCDTDDPAEHADLRRAARVLAGLSILSSGVTTDGYLVRGTWAGSRSDLVDHLKRAGIYVDGD